LLNSRIDKWFRGTRVPTQTPSDLIPRPFAAVPADANGEAPAAADGDGGVKAALETARSFLEKKGRTGYIFVQNGDEDEGDGGGEMDVDRSGVGDVSRVTAISVASCPSIMTSCIFAHPYVAIRRKTISIMQTPSAAQLWKTSRSETSFSYCRISSNVVSQSSSPQAARFSEAWRQISNPSDNYKRHLHHRD
jgi:hypothetical protein